MAITRIYIAETDLSLGEYLLDKTAHHHCVNVLRMKVGQAVILFNGQGGEYHGHFTQVSKKSAQVCLEKFIADKDDNPLQLHLIQGVSRKDRMHIAIQKAVELGVTEITPLLTEYCDLKRDAAVLEKKYQQWHAVMVSACEQSGQNVIPRLHPIQTFESWLKDFSQDVALKLAFTLFHDGKHLKTFSCSNHHVCCAIGPEGGFSETEESALLANGFQAASLGPRILRFETAAAVALAIAQHEWA